MTTSAPRNPIRNPSSNVPVQRPSCIYPSKCTATNGAQRITVDNNEYRMLLSADMNDNNFAQVLSLQNKTTGQNLGKTDAEFTKVMATNSAKNGYIAAIDSMAEAADVSKRVPELKKALDKVGQGHLLQLDVSGRPIENLRRFARSLSDPAVPPYGDQLVNSLLGSSPIPIGSRAQTSAQLATVESEDAPATPIPSAKDDKIVNLSYPVDALYSSSEDGAIKEGNDYIRIERFTYKPPQQDQLSGANNPIDNVLSAGLTRNSNLSKFIGIVKLPIPNDLNVSNGVDWGGATANPVEAAAFFGANKIIKEGLSKPNNALSTILSAVATGVGGLNALAQATGRTANAQTALSAAIAKFALSQVNINVDPAQFITRETGQTLNPNLELLFAGPKLRNFAFRFDFAPNSESDASAARKIQRFFREGMLPQATTAAPGGTSEDALFLGSPDVFRVSYFNGDKRIRGLPIHKICALTQCAINFTDQGVYQSYHDSKAGSQPVRSQMILSFTELTPIFREDYTGDGPDNKQLFGAQDIRRSTSSGIKGPLMGENDITEEDIGF